MMEQEWLNINSAAIILSLAVQVRDDFNQKTIGKIVYNVSDKY